MAEILRLQEHEVIRDPNQPRKRFPQEVIDRLTESIRKYGQKVPGGVCRDHERGKWLLRRGECRFIAVFAAGLPHFLATEVEGELTEADVIKDQLVDNLLRTDLSPLEIARALNRLQTLEGGTMASIAAQLDISPATATRCTSLLTLPADMQAAIEGSTLPVRHGYAIARLQDSAAQRELFEMVVAGKLTCTACEEEVQKRIGKRQSKPKTARATAKEGEYRLVMAGPDKAGMIEALTGLLKKLRAELAGMG
jgi:ParB family chromosome partitioning protein